MRCQNCISVDGKNALALDSRKALFSSIYSEIKPANKSDAVLNFDHDDIADISFDLAEAHFKDYWKVIAKFT